MATAIEKLQNVITKVGAVENAGEAIAQGIKARKKADLKVLNFTASTVTVVTDEGDTLRIVAKSDVADAQFQSFTKRKTSVMLPKTETVLDLEGFRIDKVEQLVPLKNVIGDDNDAFNSWLTRYAGARSTGKATRGGRDETAPASVESIVHVGNLRGLVNKLVQFNAGAMALTFDRFSVRENQDGTKQIVITDPFNA